MGVGVPVGVEAVTPGICVPDGEGGDVADLAGVVLPDDALAEVDAGEGDGGDEATAVPPVDASTPITITHAATIEAAGRISRPACQPLPAYLRRLSITRRFIATPSRVVRTH